MNTFDFSHRINNLFQGPVAAPSLNPDAEVWTSPNVNLDVSGPAYLQPQQPWVQFSNNLTNHEGMLGLDFIK